MKTLTALLMLCGVAYGQAPMFAPAPTLAPAPMFAPAKAKVCPGCLLSPCTCESCDCEECEYTPQVIGMTPVDEPDGHVTAAVANYAEAKRMAEATGKRLVVVVGKPALVAAEAKAAGDADSILCIPAPGEQSLWKAPGVYRYEMRAGKLVTARATVRPSLTVPRCVNGRCYLQ